MSYYYRVLESIPCKNACDRYKSVGCNKYGGGCRCSGGCSGGCGNECYCDRNRNRQLSLEYMLRNPSIEYYNPEMVMYREADLAIFSDKESLKPQPKPQPKPKPQPQPKHKKSESCGCEVDNNYVMPTCGYNSSPTWTDQKSFRQNVQNDW